LNRAQAESIQDNHFSSAIKKSRFEVFIRLSKKVAVELSIQCLLGVPLAKQVLNLPVRRREVVVVLRKSYSYSALLCS
jgi:hypothetical protein